MGRKKMTKAEKVWAYLLKNKLASPAEVAKATGVSYGYTFKLMKKVGTPKEIFEAEAEASAIEGPKPMARAEILTEATRLTTDSREKLHGTMESNFSCIADLWNAYLKGKHYELDASDVALMMTLVKVSRAKNNPSHADNWVDGAGYMACGGEVATAHVEYADLSTDGLPVAEGVSL